ncbi:MAG: TfoX/Sxy family protein [Nitrospinae bacterium]|nr:TfoX/Sxy family protein [Nitrospinota bacterium]
MAQKTAKQKAKRPPPRHQLTLDEAIARLGLTGVTQRRMFGGLCYYANGNPFSFLLGEDLALKLPAMQLISASASRAGDLFHPGGGEFVMREYLALSAGTLTDEDKIDEFVQASYGFVSGRGSPEEGLAQRDLLEGRSGLYQKKKRPARHNEKA